MSIDFIYAGPSWATLSYGDGPITNLAAQWDIRHKSICHRGARNTWMKHLLEAEASVPVVFLYCEPLVDIFQGTKSNNRRWVNSRCNEYVKTVDHRAYRKSLAAECLENLNSLNIPIGFIGAHSDIHDSDITGLDNLTVIHPSWQQWMKDVCDVSLPSLNFGCEVAHNLIKYFSVDIDPQEMLINDIHDQYAVWDKLEEAGYFSESHPNRRSNIEFAEFVKPAVVKFLKDNT